MAQAEWRAGLAMGTMARPAPGTCSAHSSTCIPPSEPPMTDADAPDPERPAELALDPHHVAHGDGREGRRDTGARWRDRSEAGPVVP